VIIIDIVVIYVQMDPVVEINIINHCL